MTGRTVDSKQQRNKSGSFSFEMDVQALDNGIYAIENTTFDCTYQLLTNYLGALQTDTAIYTANATFQLKNDPVTGLPNIIQNCHVGLAASVNIGLYVYDNEFRDIRENGDFASFGTSGMAMYLSDNGYSELRNNLVNNCDQGLWLRKCADTDIINNNLSRIDDPILGGQNNNSIGTAIDGRQFDHAATVLIKNNVINDVSIGMQLGQFSGVSLTVDNNDFDYTTPYPDLGTGDLEGLGISCFDIGFISNGISATDIINNTMNLMHEGIRLLNINGAWGLTGGGNLLLTNTVDNNQISVYNQPYGYLTTGIFCEMINLTGITRNTVNSVYDPNWYQAGIRSESATGVNFVACNTVHGVWDAFWFGLDNSGTFWIKNQIYDVDAGTGLRFNWGRIGNQGSGTNSHDNEWLNNTGTAGSCWPGTPSAETRTFGINLIDDNMVVQSGCPTEPLLNEEASAGVAMTVVTTGTGWTGADCPVVKTWRLDSIYSVAERVKRLKNGLVRDTLNSLRDSSLSWMHELNMYSLLEFDTAAVNNDSTLRAYRDSCRSSGMAYLYRALNALNDTASVAQKGGLRSYADTMGIIAPVYVPEANLRNGLTKLYNWYDSGLLSATDQSWLRTMADNCPYDAGGMVYLSRSVLLGLDTLPTWTVNTCELAQAPPAARLGAPDNAEDATEERMDADIDLRIYPNPTRGQLTVVLDNCPDKDASNYRLTIFDMMGRTVYSRSLTCGQQVLNLEGIDKGTYLVRVVSEDNTTQWNLNCC